MAKIFSFEVETQSSLVIVSTTIASLVLSAWWIQRWQENRSSKRQHDHNDKYNGDYTKKGDNDETTEQVNQFRPCPNPNCVRCRTYAQVNVRARERLQALVVSATSDPAQRIIDAVQQGPNLNLGSSPSQSPSQSQEESQQTQPRAPVPNQQYPNVLFVPGLLAEPVVSRYHEEACARLESHAAEIWQEYQQASLQQQQHLIDNDVPCGQWQALYLQNQGRWNQQVVEQLCPTTFRIVQENLDWMDNVFGNVFFSVLHANGTVIEPHCGPCNIRHRLHLTLHEGGNEANSRPVLNVAGQDLSWTRGEAFVFDDSLVHSARYNSAPDTPSSTPPRVVLIVDLWHHELTFAERQLVSELYQ